MIAWRSVNLAISPECASERSGVSICTGTTSLIGSDKAITPFGDGLQESVAARLILKDAADLPHGKVETMLEIYVGFRTPTCSANSCRVTTSPARATKMARIVAG